MIKKNIIIIGMAVIILALLGVIFYNSVFKKEITEPNPIKDIQKDEKQDDTQENLLEVANKLQKIAVDSLVFGHIGELNQDKIIHQIILDYYIEKKKNSNVLNIEISKEELDLFLKKYYNYEVSEYTDIRLKDCNEEENVLLKYDQKKSKYITMEAEEQWLCNGPIPYDFKPFYTKIYGISKYDDTYFLTLTGIWWYSGEIVYDLEPDDQKIRDNGFQNDNLLENVESYEERLISYYDDSYEEQKEKYKKYQIEFKKKDNGDFYIINIKSV